MQAIETKFLPASNTCPSRIKATALAGSLTISYDHALDSDGNHRQAAQMLMDRYGWSNQIVGGTLAGGGMVWVMLPEVR